MSGEGGPPARTAPGGAPAIRTLDLVKDFGFRRVLDGVSLEVARGRFLALFGPNGAGKTTLIRILTTLSRPTSGSAEIGGVRLGGGRAASIRAQIGLIAHQTLVYDGLSGMENLVFFGRLFGVARPRERAERLLREFDLWERRDDRVGTWSRGMQQRLAIARAMMHEPSILFLDEPFTGLDPSAARLLRGLLERLKQTGRSAILTTHDLDQGLALCDEWAILGGGQIAAIGSSAGTRPADLTEIYFRTTGLAGAPAPGGAP